MDEIESFMQVQSGGGSRFEGMGSGRGVVK